MTARIELDGIGKRFGPAEAVRDLTIDIAPGRFTALLGPSGCGKSTTLAMIAGLLRPDSGDIRLDGTSVRDVPAERRPVSLVFQKSLLFPHLSAGQNIAFGLRMRRLRRAEISRRTQAILDRVQLGGLGERRVGELSGGQEQRVALARALVLEPRVLLLDEPFSQLDPELREDMRALVRRLHDESGTTTMFVTHDRAEAVEVADDIALMLDGRLAGHGPPEMFYRSPPSLAAARFFGVGAELRGVVTGGRFRAASGLDVPVSQPDGPAILTIRPEAIRLGAADVTGSETAPLSAQVVGARFAGTHLVVELRMPDADLTAHVPVDTHVRVGTNVFVTLPEEACTVFDDPGP